MQEKGEMMSRRPPVVVIGAGASGLPSIKSCLEEGLQVICYEKTEYIGGLWRFREEVEDGLASVMRTTVINSSKEMSCYSDFPAPANFPNFMHNRQQLDYFHRYADAFDLRRHIRHCHEVLSVTPTKDYDATGHWNVLVKNLKTNEITEVLALGVMVSSGHHSIPYIPEFRGLENFKGKVIHSHSYKDFKGFEDLRVVVVGVGNSGGDIAVELSRISSTVYLSMRRGTWIINRVGLRGLPTDYLHLRRFLFGPNSFIPRKIVDYFATLLHNMRVDHDTYDIKPEHSFFGNHPMVNDALPNCLLCGTVIAKNDIDHFTSNGVVFKGSDNTEIEVDVVILATGYDIRFPFLDPSILSTQNNQVHLYKYVFPPALHHPTLAVIGLIQPLGSIVPIAEMQARWVVRLLNKKISLPERKVQEDDIERLRKELEEKFAQTRRHTVQVDYMTYTDEIANMVGVKPDLKSLFFKDFTLFLYCMLGANVPYQYRINGPHKWVGAREAIMTSDKRVRAPLQTRTGPPSEKPVICQKMQLLKGSRLWKLVIMAFGIMMVILCFTLV